MSIRDAVQALGIQVRAGLHTGECQSRATISVGSACTSAHA
jgi:class 3 adenylate cyclase